MVYDAVKLAYFILASNGNFKVNIIFCLVLNKLQNYKNTFSLFKETVSYPVTTWMTSSCWGIHMMNVSLMYMKLSGTKGI